MRRVTSHVGVKDLRSRRVHVLSNCKTHITRVGETVRGQSHHPGVVSLGRHVGGDREGIQVLLSKELLRVHHAATAEGGVAEE